MIYRQRVRNWVKSNQLEEMLRALESGDVRLFGRMLRVIVMRIMSYHDTGGEPKKGLSCAGFRYACLDVRELRDAIKRLWSRLRRGVMQWNWKMPGSEIF